MGKYLLTTNRRGYYKMENKVKETRERLEALKTKETGIKSMAELIWEFEHTPWKAHNHKTRCRCGNIFKSGAYKKVCPECAAKYQTTEPRFDEYRPQPKKAIIGEGE